MSAISITTNYHTASIKSNKWTLLPLTLGHFQDIYEICNQYEPYSDTFPTTIWSYDRTGAKVLRAGNAVLIHMSDWINPKNRYYTIIGGSDSKRLINDCLSNKVKRNTPLLFKHVPHETVEFLKDWDAVVEISEDIDNHDYIYSVDHLINMRSRALRSKARDLKRLHANHSKIRVVVGSQADKVLVHDVLMMIRIWAQQISAVTWNLEYAAMKKLLSQNVTQLTVVALYDDEKIIGYTINEAIHNKYYLGHSGKSDRNYKGANVAIEHETAKAMRTQYGSKFVNLAQDLGIAGLKQYKESWGPTTHLKKYILHIDTNKLISP